MATGRIPDLLVSRGPAPSGFLSHSSGQNDVDKNDGEQRMNARLTVFYHFVFDHFVLNEQYLARVRKLTQS